MKTKNWITLLAVMVMATIGYAQSGEAPESVKNALMEKYSTAQITGAKSVDGETWTVNFSDSFGDHRSQFSQSGDWLSTRSTIDLAKLPSAVSATLDANFNGFDLYKAAKYDSPKQKGYVVKMRKGDQLIEAMLDTEGNLVKPTTLDDAD